MNKTQARHLILLANKLDRTPLKRYYGGKWKVVNSCGTTHCAGGLACTIREIAAAGLYLAHPPWDSAFWVVRFKGHPECEGSFAALRAYFGLTGRETDRIFNGSCTTPKEVAEVIRTVVSQHQFPTTV